MSTPAPRIPMEGVSTKVKMMVLLLTVVTVAAFGLFFFKLFSRMASPARATSPAPWLEVAQALENAGLKGQAAEQYALYLKTAKIDRATRAATSLRLGRLYLEGNDCASALAWLLHAKLTASDPAIREAAAGLADNCAKNLPQAPPAGGNLLE